MQEGCFAYDLICIIRSIEGHKGKIYDFAAVEAELWCIIARLHQSGAPEMCELCRKVQSQTLTEMPKYIIIVKGTVATKGG